MSLLGGDDAGALRCWRDALAVAPRQEAVFLKSMPPCESRSCSACQWSDRRGCGNRRACG